MRYSSDAYINEKVVKKVLLSLEQILTVVAKDKGLSNPSKWVEERLTHCEVHSDYYNYIHLKSHKKMWFGVRDTKFNCQPFVLYREFCNTEEQPMKEFEIYTFRTLEDPQFMALVKEAYQDLFDSIRDIRLFYDTVPVLLRIKTEDGLVSLGEYNDLDDGFKVETSLYCLNIEGSNLYVYSVHREKLELDIVKLRLFFHEVEDREGVYTSNIVKVSKMGVPVPFEVLQEGQSWTVHWLD